MPRKLIEDILNNGEPSLRELIGRAESFDLEFKTKEDPKDHHLSKADKRNLAKALSGFSNADGGVTIFGISTKHKGRQDIADELRPISDIMQFKNEVDGSLGDLLRPSNPSIKTYAISSDGNSSFGYLLVEIDQSDFRPHMSMAPDHQKYFRRSVGGTLVMDHGMVRDLMMVQKEAHIFPIWRISIQSIQGSQGKTIYNGRLDLYLANEGLAMAALPYARIWTDPKLQYKNVNPAVTSSPRPDSSAAYYGNIDSVIHPDDEVMFSGFSITITADIENITKLVRHRSWDRAVSQDVWKVGANFDRNRNLFDTEISTLDIHLNVGAENATKRVLEWSLTRADLVRMTLEYNIGQFSTLKSEIENLSQALRNAG